MVGRTSKSEYNTQSEVKNQQYIRAEQAMPPQIMKINIKN